MTTDQVQLFLIIATILVAGFALYRSYAMGNLITLSGAVDTIKGSVPVAQELQEIVQIAVNSVEQLKREGKIDSNDVAFNHALDLVKKWVPKEWHVDNEDIFAAINAAVLVSSALARQAGSSSEDAQTFRQQEQE